ncbi:MAG: T9SS type A sorting domain-containing protein, partial [Crocinitomicaceae bacterium]|nr:T9SS type A sorting domain-containing protein [Crocinitomicaceae bacterium]
SNINSIIGLCSAGSTSTTSYSDDVANIQIGSSGGSGALSFTGLISEAIVYSKDLSDALIHKVESYLAVKYGLTLDNSLGGTDGDYISSSGTLFWDASLTPDYHTDIIAIGKDYKSDLIQKQSHTFDDTTRVYLGTLQTNNILNSEILSNDESFLILGHNRGLISSTPASNSEIPSGCTILTRLEREWKITKTDFPEDFNFDLKLSPGAAPSAVNTVDLRLLIDDDGDFSNGGTDCYFNGDGTGFSFSYNNPIITITGISGIQIPNNSTKYMTIASVSNSTPLPIQLISLQAVSDGEKVILSWATASEVENKSFNIERSRNGTEWQEIAKIDCTGNSSSIVSYEISDENPFLGISYYRLKQYDFNNHFEYSQSVSVNFKQSETGYSEIFPNPAISHVTLLGSPNELVNTNIYHILGKNVTPLTKQTAINENQLIIDISKLTKGVYCIQTKTTTYKFYKQ